MKSIFNTDDNAELIRRIDQLSVNAPALWGKMNVAQMMAHCQAGMNVAFGNTKRPYHWIGFVFGSIGKRRVLKMEKLDRHMPAYRKYVITDDRYFDLEKQKLVFLIKSALTKGESGLVKYPHPYFGKFKPGEWSQLNWKHLDHHLRQFAV